MLMMSPKLQSNRQTAAELKQIEIEHMSPKKKEEWERAPDTGQSLGRQTFSKLEAND